MRARVASFSPQRRVRYELDLGKAALPMRLPPRFLGLYLLEATSAIPLSIGPPRYGRTTGPRGSGTVAALSFQSFDHGVSGGGCETPSTRMSSTCSLKKHR